MDEGQELDTLLRAIPEGWTRAEVAGQTWSVTRVTRAGGKVISIDAQRLGDTEQVGANIWITSEGPVLRPCEVPAESVMQVLRAAATNYSASAEKPDIGGQPLRCRAPLRTE